MKTEFLRRTHQISVGRIFNEFSFAINMIPAHWQIVYTDSNIFSAVYALHGEANVALLSTDAVNYFCSKHSLCNYTLITVDRTMH